MPWRNKCLLPLRVSILMGWPPRMTVSVCGVPVFTGVPASPRARGFSQAYASLGKLILGIE